VCAASVVRLLSVLEFAVCICSITMIFAYTWLLNGSVEYMVTTLDILCL
jgi:hypothetical protein